MYPVAAADKVELTLYFKTGSIYENDSFAGINNVIRYMVDEHINDCLKKNKNGINPSNTLFTSHIQPEHTFFRFITSENNMGAVLQLMRDSVFKARFRQMEIDTALARVKEQIQANDTLAANLYKKHVLREVFRQDFRKLTPAGNPEKFRYINITSLTKYFDKYYVAGNAIVSATGQFSTAVFDQHLYDALSPISPSEFDPETITKIIDIRPMIYSNQLIAIDTVQTPEFRIYWQFPGTFSYQQGSFMAFLLTEAMNDPNNYLNILAARMGCKKLEAVYEPSNFTGVFYISLQPDKNKLAATLDWLLFELNRINLTLANESMVNAAKIRFLKRYDEQNKTKDFADKLVRFWPYKESSYYLDIRDSIVDITDKEMRRFVGEYIVQNAHFTTLTINAADREELKVDSFFTNVTDSVSDFIFTYRPNITDLEGEENLTRFNQLAQWLKMNRDVNVLINGFADKSEYNKSFSDTIMKFIDSIPTFRKFMPDIIKKGYLRPEMMRPLKLIKMLNERGIALSRLAGTSMVFNKYRSEVEENRKCTLTLTKLRNIISLKEYHYGKRED